MLRQLVKRYPLVYRHAVAARELARRARHDRRWPHPERLSNGAKIRQLREIAKTHGLHVFVETGTYEGETPYWLRNDFTELYTIELEPQLYALAAARLAPYSQISVLQGDSPAMLTSVLARIDRPALFWLDSHACTTKSAAGGSPVLRELELIFAHPVAGHVALIDDIRLLGSSGWPTLDELAARAERAGRRFEVADDIARVLP